MLAPWCSSAFLYPPGSVSPSRPLQCGLPELLAHSGLRGEGNQTSYTAELGTIRPGKSHVQNQRISTSVFHQPEESQDPPGLKGWGSRVHTAQIVGGKATLWKSAGTGDSGGSPGMDRWWVRVKDTQWLLVEGELRILGIGWWPWEEKWMK